MERVRGVVAHKKGAQVSVETIVVPDPGPGEALVRVQACGVCHTDLHYREGAINDDFPFLLGHEASGTVERVGPGVDNGVRGGLCDSCLAGPLWQLPFMPKPESTEGHGWTA